MSATDQIAPWFTGRLPDSWFTGPPEVSLDRDEILVVGVLPAVEGGAEAGRLSRFREETRDARIGIAREAEQLFGRKVAWGAVCGEQRQVFTALAVPVMTRLRQPERQVLDTLVDAGVARSRSDALAWCVKLVGANAEAWLQELRTAMHAVQRVREQDPVSPTAGGTSPG